MKKLKLFFACLLMAVLSIGQVWAETVEFTPSNCTNWTSSSTNQSQTIDGITISSTAAANNTQLRLYSGGTHTFTSTVGNITKIEFTCTASGTNSNGPGKMSLASGSAGSYSYSGTLGTWTGDAATCALYNGQSRCTKIVVTYTPSGSGSGKENLTDEQLSWSATSANITFGDEPYSLPSLTNSIPVSVTYESTAEAVATISNVGVVSVLKAGSTTIKAVFAGNDDYNAKTVSYTLTVAPAPLTPIAGGIVDEIKISDLLTSGSGYQPFSDKQASNEGHSDAVYAGKVCISSTNIQMNTIGTNTSAGRSIVTTTSGGNAKRVQAFWGGTNAADRKLTVYGSNTAYAGTETAASGTKLGDLTYASGDSYAYIDITGDYAYLQIVASGAIYMSQINITWVAPDVSKVATPEISGTANFYPSTSVSISCSTDDAAIYYTTDGTAPTSASTLYEGAFTVNADGTTTVKAIAVKDGMTDSDVAERTFTKATVLTVASALSAASGANVYVTGTITSITEVSIQHKNATYVISDVTAGVPANEMIIYRGKYVDGADFDSEDQIHVGDVVVVSGTIGVYQEKNQLAQGNQIESITPAAVVAPVFSPDGGGFMGETDVTITCATEGSAIYYTLDGTTPSKSSTLYTAAIHLTETKTITAIAYVGEESSLVVAKAFTYTSPMTVADAFDELSTTDPLNNTAVSGIVFQVDACAGGTYATYWISDDGTDAAKKLEIYHGYGLEGANFAANGIRVGDEVTVFGNLTIYKQSEIEVCREFIAGSRLLAFNRPQVAVTGINLTESTAEVEEGKTVTLHASVVPANATNKTIVWSVQSGNEKAEVDANGVVTGIAAGEAVIRAASDEDATIFAECTVTVTEPAPLSPWASVYTSNVTLSTEGGTSASAAKVKFYGEEGDGYDAIKAGTGSAQGAVVVNVPAGATALHFHAYGWTSESVGLTVTAPTGVTVSPATEISINSNSGIANNSPFTLAEGSDPKTDAYYAVSLSGNTEATNITISATSGKRFVLFGVNQEGGVVPELKSIAISGDLDKKSYKAGQALDMTGLTVTATYQLGEETPYNVDITSNAGLTWTYDPLVENQDEVTVTAHFGDPEKTASKTIEGLTVTSADPKIYVSTLNVNFASVEVGESVPAAEKVTVTLTNVASVTATLGGTNADAFSVSPASLTESGDITISILANTDAAASYSATLTISDGAEGAEDKTVNLSFVVTEPVVTEEYQLVSDVTSLAAGDQVIIVAENEGDYYTLDGSISSQYFPSTAVSIAAGIITAPSTSAIILGKDGGNWTMSMGGQLIGATAAKKASLGNNDASNTWTIAIAENVATIANTTEAYGKLQFNYNNGTNPRFLNYASVQTAVAIYKKVAAPEPTPDYTREVTNGHYGTICLPKAGTIEGATLYEIGAFENNLIYIDEVGTTLEAGVPYIFYASGAQLNVYYTDKTAGDVPADDANGLIGFYDLTDEDATFDIPKDAENYILYNDQYWLVSGRAAYIANYRAYIKRGSIVPKSAAPGRRRVAMAVNGENAATGFENIESGDAPMKVMIDGTMYILRGEKVYDATGRLVK